MKTSFDIRDLLEGWPYDAEHTARIVPGDDGRDVLQVRLLMGLEQYELEGRPDGQRPQGRESLLDYQLGRFARARAAGKEADFTLDAPACAALFEEGTLYYYRYLHLFQLRDWVRTVRDTDRNLRLFDFVHRYAEREEDQMYLEQWRPYLLRMNAVARAMIELDHSRHDDAMRVVRAAVVEINGLPELDDETFRFERQRSLAALNELAEQMEEKRPRTQLERLEGELRGAIERQEFERAAVLRDQIRTLRSQRLTK